MFGCYVAFAGFRFSVRLSALAGARGRLMDGRPPLSTQRHSTGGPRAWQAYLAFGAAGMFLYLLVPPLKGNPLYFNALGLTSWVAVIVGIRRNRRRTNS